MESVRRRCIKFFLVLVGVVCSFSAQAAYEYTIVDFPGAVSTQLWGINNAGRIVGIAYFADTTSLSFVYDSRKGTFTPVAPVPGEDRTDLLGINEPGTLVGGASNADFSDGIGVIRNKNGAFTLFSHPAPLENTTGRAVGPSGLVTGYARDEAASSYVGFIYDPAHDSFIDIAFPDAGITIAQGINGRGQVVGSASLPPGGAYPGSAPREYGFLRAKNGAITLFRVNDVATRTRARGITDSGLITGFVGPLGANIGFVGKLSGAPGFELLVIPAAQLLEVPGAASTQAQGINNSGRVVGAWDDGNLDGFQHGFIATPLPKGKK